MAPGDWRARLGDRFADVWVLLSDTDQFMSRARLMPRYERRLREWRRRLQEARNDPEKVKEIRGEIVAVRRALREEGWELRLGSMDVQVRGFRSDDSFARGFRRMVLLIAPGPAFYYITGDSNHMLLEDELRARLNAQKIHLQLVPHYLWYRVAAGVIELAGADSETRDWLEELRTIVEENKSGLVRAFRSLH